jgi:GntR family transcriptional regulator
MPTEGELATQHRLSRQTVRRAYQSLAHEGLIHRTRGRGTFVTAVRPDGRYLRTFGSIDDLMAQSADSTMEVVEPMRSVTDERLSAKLLAPGPVGTLLVRRNHAGQAFCLTQVSVPMAVMRALAPVRLDRNYVGGTIIEEVDRVWPSRVCGAKQRIQAGPCPPVEAEHLACEPGEPVLQVERLYYDDNGDFVELAESVYVGRRFAYRIEVLRTFQ